jgi:transposase
MEACGGSQHWARKLQEMGHEVKLMSGKMVKAFVCGNKNDAGDARAIYMAAMQPEVMNVAVKTEAQQAVLAMHRIRQQLVKMRTAQINELRGLLAEYGEVFGTGRKAFDTGIKAALERLAERLPMPLIDTLRDQWNELARLDERIARIRGVATCLVARGPRRQSHCRDSGCGPDDRDGGGGRDGRCEGVPVWP